MPNRTTTFTSTVFATVLAGTGLMSAGCAPARAADDCLSGPNHATSAGGHWYYRVDRQSHRKCWYLADQGQKTEQVRSAKPVLSAKTNSQRAAERIPQPNADARAELPPLPALPYIEPPDQPNVSEKPDAQPFTDAPPRSVPEDPVPPAGNVLLNAAPPGDSEPGTMNAVKDAATEAAPEALPAAANREPVAQLPADETAMSTFRLTLSLLLMATGLAAVTAAMIFKRSARRDDVPFHIGNTAGEPEEAFAEMTSEEMASLALTHDVPLFLVHGRSGPN
jgi:hypothetical protein